MKVEIVRIVDRGIANKERLHMKVLADTNLTYYAIFSTEYATPTSVSSRPKLAFWFADMPVKAGDQVVLYTGSGQQKSERNSSGFTNHFFYWGQQITLWNKRGDCAVLLEISSWQTTVYE